MNGVKPADVRGIFVSRLERDLIGPDAEDETIGKGRRSRPSDYYLTGILWPLGNRLDESDDDGGGDDAEEGDSQATPGLLGQQRPCTMGLSFATSQSEGEPRINVSVTFGTYVPQEVKDGDGKLIEMRWTRTGHSLACEHLAVPLGESREIKLASAGLEADLRLHLRGRNTSTGTIVTVTLLNLSKPEPERVEMERATLFQTRMEITPCDGTSLVPRPANPDATDKEGRLGQLLFRKEHEYATGHQCSVGWEGAQGSASRIWTSWLPRATVPAFREDGHEVFADSVKKGTFDAESLATCSQSELKARLEELADAYAKWIKITSGRTDVPADMRDVADENLRRCRDVLARITANIATIVDKPLVRRSFQLAMKAMALQFSWRLANEAKAAGTTVPSIGLRWRPFQLAFIVLAAVSTCDRNAEDREAMDLLWFPTGGGKTEAYLALVAMLVFHRRLSSPGIAGEGNTAVMRYTLRLLTAQQFERATALIMACELIRKQIDELKGSPFSIGLWVGGDATPNSFDDALSARGTEHGPSAEQIERCCCCGSKLSWMYDEKAQSVNPYCGQQSCELGAAFGNWPVWTVDSDLYRECPTLVIGTVDKFAIMPRKPEMGRLFGFRTNHSPDLIIQDELHLISGPLGTLAGLYEVGFDWLVSKSGRRPKVIGSTATIRRAEDQIRALFDRTASQFPPPGFDHDDSGFAVRDPAREGRLYVGVSTCGRSAKFTLQAAAASLLESGARDVVASPAECDGYTTLLCYFNSLRELGGAIVQMLDDVPDSIDLYSSRRSEPPRELQQPRELTSRASQKEIIGTLGELKRSAASGDQLDVVLATNMVSVGVDVPRLGLMLVNGQPKTRSEYIQSTSRVGRKDFPGLVISVLNAAKARDRSHFETFPGWHSTLYRDVEATSVTPFASRARDRALHAVLVSMIRHGCAAVGDKPKIDSVPDEILQSVVEELERRVAAVDKRELESVTSEINRRLQDWEERHPVYYLNDYKPKESLMQSAERFVRRKAAGMLSGSAWPVMNNMRSVEPSTRVRMTEILRTPDSTGQRWRKKKDGE
jgi:hypothetical protein